MNYFDKEKQIKNLFKEFETIDRFNTEFLKKFSQKVFEVVTQYCQQANTPVLFGKTLDIYARNILNACFSVIEKDTWYADYKLKEELSTITHLALKAFNFDNNLLLQNDLHQKSKELIHAFFPHIIELSGDGLRLLEANSLLYTRHFITAVFNNTTH